MIKGAASKTTDEQRRSFRVNDNVGLKYRTLSEKELEDALRRFNDDCDQFNLVSKFAHQKQGHLPRLKVIQMQHPEVAAYLESLEEQIDTLAKMITADYLLMPEHPTHEVNISSHGIRFCTQEALPAGAYLELRLQLFPSKVCIHLYGKVTWCKGSGDSADNRNAVAADFTHIHEADREMLVTHIHKKQMTFLTSGQTAKRS